MERNHGLELILHKFYLTTVYSILGDKNYQELFAELKDVGIVFEGISAFSWAICLFTKDEKMSKPLREIEFVIIKSVANHIKIKYGAELSLKYPDPEIQEYYTQLKPLSIEDLLKRCRCILKKYKNLTKRQKLK